jgi:predicted XRE-type DNA-binding protein
MTSKVKAGKKKNLLVARNASDLAEALGLSPADGAEIEVRSALNQKIVEAVTKSGLTHVQVAKLAQTSRTRMTALLNYNSQGVSTDLMLRILRALGFKAKITFLRAA